MSRPERSRSAVIAIAAGCACLAALVAGGLFRLEIRTDVAALLPAGDRVTESAAEKDDDFGGDAVVVILESDQPRSLLTEQEQLLRLVALEGDLARLPDVAAVYGPATVLNQTAGAAQDMLAQIMGRRDGLRQEAIAAAMAKGASSQAATEAGKRAVRDFDERYGALLVQGMPAGLPTLRNPRFVQTVLFDDHQQPRPEWRSVVPDSNRIAILARPRGGLDQAAASRLSHRVEEAVAGSDLKVSRSTVTGVPVVTAGLSDRAADEAPRLGALSLVVVGMVFVLVPWTRLRSRLRPTLAAVIGSAATLACFGWLDRPVSLGVVAFLPILLGIGSDFPLYLSRPGQDRPALTAAAAGALGFLSLALSPLPFVKELGVALAVGLVLTVLTALVLRRALGPVPALPGRPQPEDPERSSRAAGRRPLVLAGTVAGMVAALAGWALLPGLTVESQPEQLAAGLPELADAEYAEDVLGSTGEISIVVRGDDVASPAVLEWSRQSQTRVVRELGDRVHPVLSLSDLFRFLGAKPAAAEVDAAMEIMPRYLTSAVVRSDREVGVMVYGVEFDDVAQLSALVDDLERATADPPAGTTAEVVGLPVTAVRGLELVSDGRLLINLAGIAVATLAVGLGLRSARAAGRALVVVLLATGWVVLLASVTTGALNPLTVAVGSLVTATGCEFAVMLGTRVRTSARSVVTAAGAGTAGYLVLAASELAVLRDFGLLLAGGVVCSLLAALLVNGVTNELRSGPGGGGHADSPASPETDLNTERETEEVLV
jgi:predicted RND superfamily exporter protein